MKAYRTKTSKSPFTTSSTEPSNKEKAELKNVKHEVLLQIPGCKVHLMDEGEALELADGDFILIRISTNNVALATIVKVGKGLQWPLTKDEPVMKLDCSHYVFSFPMKDGAPLSYGVSFSEKGPKLDLLDSVLRQNSCFSILNSSRRSKDINWEEFAPKINDYNNVLAKAIAEGTGHIVKGIFQISNSYANQLQKGTEIMLTDPEEKNVVKATESKSKTRTTAKQKDGSIAGLKRAKKLSETTENLSKSLLFGINTATGSAMKPVVQTHIANAFLETAPGEVLLASLDAINSILDAAEAAEKQALSVTSAAATGMVTRRFGEGAGEATGDALATAGHCAGTAWNLLKIRKAVIPSSAAASGMIKNSVKK